MLEKRPKLRIPLTVFEKVLEIISVITIVVIFVFVIVNYNSMVDKIPTHFDISGQPNGWGSKKGLLVFPIFMFLLYLGLTVLCRFPHVFNYIGKITEENAPFQYLNARMLINTIKAEIIIFFGYIEFAMILVGKGVMHGIGAGFTILYLVVLFGSVIFFIIRMIRGS